MVQGKYDACVIGCGEIGSNVLYDMHMANPKLNIIGYDISVTAIDNWNRRVGSPLTPGWPKVVAGGAFPDADVYFICLWTTDSVLEYLPTICHAKLILIETTIDPTLYTVLAGKVREWWRMADKTVLFPHRFNPGDNDHRIFNLDRLIGGFTLDGTLKAINWLTKHNLMEEKYLHVVDPQVAVMSKVVENAYRAWEIILAQELKKSCGTIGMDFDALRRAVNTKWNIDVREARNGVAGKCLPKDLNLFNKTFPGNTLSQLMYLLNEQYLKDNAPKS